eukprot:3755748-Amphidinium_carterae.1
MVWRSPEIKMTALSSNSTASAVVSGLSQRSWKPVHICRPQANVKDSGHQHSHSDSHCRLFESVVLNKSYHC